MSSDEGAELRREELEKNFRVKIFFLEEERRERRKFFFTKIFVVRGAGVRKK